MATKVEAAQLLVYKAAMAKATQKVYSVEAAKAKLYAAEVAMEVTTKAVQLHGGYGYIREYDVERMMRDAKITEIYEGTSEVQRMVISGSLLKYRRIRTVKIVVCVKQVPDTKGGVQFNPDGTLNRAAMLAIMNPDDKAGTGGCPETEGSVRRRGNCCDHGSSPKPRMYSGKLWPWERTRAFW